MRLVIQRVLEASVKVDGTYISKTGPGLLVLVGITHTDTKDTVKKAALKVLKMRLWHEKKKTTTTKTADGGEIEETKDEEPRKTWACSVMDYDYEVLAVSQFTLYAVLKGNKPDFHNAREPKSASELFENFCDELRKNYKADKIQTGKFQHYMNVGLVNDGPVTIVWDTDEKGDSDQSPSPINVKSTKGAPKKEKKKPEEPKTKATEENKTQEGKEAVSNEPTQAGNPTDNQKTEVTTKVNENETK